MWVDSLFVPITVLVSNCRQTHVLIYSCEVGGILGGVTEHSRSLGCDSVLLVTDMVMDIFFGTRFLESSVITIGHGATSRSLESSLISFSSSRK